MNLNLLKKIALHALGWLGAFCAVLISPVIIVYGAPLVVGAVSDIIRLGYGPMAVGLLVSAVLLRRAFRTAKPVAA
jgi:hypothetical protein